MPHTAEDSAAPPVAERARPLRAGWISHLSWSGWLGLTVLTVLLIVTIFGRQIAPFHEAEIVEYGGFTPPSVEYLLGTDYLGRDLLSRLLWGGQMTLMLSVSATLLAYAIGVTLGVFAAVAGGWIDVVISRINDAFLAIPNIMLGLLVIAAFGSGLLTLICVTGVIYATGVLRIARALALDVCNLDFVGVARSRGEGSGWIIFREILPNIMLPLASDFGIRLVYVLLFISSLSFLGLGVQPPSSDWGSMVQENLIGMMIGSAAPLYPALMVAAVSVSINLIVDDLSVKSGGLLAKRML
ncbi:ABC transporter permease [Rhodobacter sp.]